MSTTATRERPIIFSGPMVKAILEGRKTQTRRICKPPTKAVFLPDDHWQIDVDEPGTAYLDDESGRLRISCPYGQPSDRLWVKETWGHGGGFDVKLNSKQCSIVEHPSVVYRATHPWLISVVDSRWRSPRYMPRWASRITLEITDVRVQRLQDISLEDVLAEGIKEITDGPHANQYWREETGLKFVDLWDSINGRKRGCSWSDDPWVWVLTFRRIENRDGNGGRNGK